MQQSLFGFLDDTTPQHLDMPDAEVIYYPSFIPPSQATALFKHLEQSLDWKQEQITLYGKAFNVPRLQAWYGDHDAVYKYSSLELSPTPWTESLRELKTHLEKELNTSFNSVLANFYRTGQDSMGRHADNEPELGINPTIASLSFGGTRNLDFHHIHNKQKVRISLDNGSLLLMKGTTQTHWQHSIVKTHRPIDPRINLTFRYIVN